MGNGPSPGTGGRSQALGRRGEDLAAKWYEAAGYEVVERNWRSPFGGELDLVCRRGGLLVVCEVKARQTVRYGSPLEAVDARKRRRLRRLASQYLAVVELPGPGLQVRFDVATLGPDRTLTVLEGAFV